MEMNKQEVIKTQEDTIRIPIKYNDELKKIVRYVFNIGHVCTAFLTAGNSARSEAVTAKSNQKYGFVRVSLTQG